LNRSLRCCATFLVLAAGACGAPRRPVTAPAAAADECALPGNESAARDTLAVALPGAIDPAHAPVGASEAERFLFRALYESLIRVDCTGRALPALAEAWAPEEGGRRWTFILRRDARFWDGEPVTAQDVVAAWTAHDTLAALAPWEGPVAQAAQVMSERIVAVTLRRPSRDVPGALAHPGLAVTKTAPGLRWPIGTGRYWLDESSKDVVAAPAFGESLPVLRFRPLAGTDARDLLDAGVDLLVTAEPAALSYAGTRSDLNAVPLLWDRTYVLLTPPGATTPFGADRSWGRDREALARDAVRAEARPAEPPHWWESLAGCPALPAAASPPAMPPSATSRRSAPRRLAYERGDPIARDLANRLVAVAGGPLVAAALGRDATELRSGSAAAYVLPMPRVPLDPCAAALDLVARAPWLDLRAVVPLVDVRRRAVLRRGLPPLTLDWDGTLRFAPR
jgi:extracellular solute-binding protein (family 5)